MLGKEVGMALWEEKIQSSSSLLFLSSCFQGDRVATMSLSKA